MRARRNVFWPPSAKPCSGVANGPLLGRSDLQRASVQPSVLRTLAPGAELQLGDGVGMSGTVVCAGKKIIIGEKTIIGSGAVLFDNDGHEPAADGSWPAEYVKSARPILIGRGVFIGARSIIMKGVQIGDGAVIGIGSVVTRNVPPNSIYFGNPAREIGVRAIPFSD